jgi:hypothetical protein
VSAFVTAGAGFLLAVLWFDLMFDVQARRPELPDGVAAYYARVTTGARPMNRLVGLVMLGTLAAIAAQIAGDDAPAWAAWASLALVGGAVVLAALSTFPHAVRLGSGRDPGPERHRLARSILRDHLACLGLVVAALVVQLGWAA